MWSFASFRNRLGRPPPKWSTDTVDSPSVREQTRKVAESPLASGTAPTPVVLVRLVRRTEVSMDPYCSYVEEGDRTGST
jgi:hypothetical protein